MFVYKREITPKDGRQKIYLINYDNSVKKGIEYKPASIEYARGLRKDVEIISSFFFFCS